MIALMSVGAADAGWLAELHALAFDEPWLATDVAVLIGSPGVRAFAARLDGAAVAFILCRTAADEAEILTLATAPEGRRRGAASALVEAAAEAARIDGASRLFLEVAEDNPGALALYRCRGFAEVGRRRGYYRRPDGAVAAVLMRRHLAP